MGEVIFELSTGERPTRLCCPECPGALVVRQDGPARRLRFACLVGHAFSTAELLEAKEDRVEEALWTAVVDAVLPVDALAAALPRLAAGEAVEVASRDAATVRARR